MFLSRLILNSRARAVRRDLGDCQQLHRTILSAFPPLAETSAENTFGARAQFGVLFRAEAEPHSGRVTLLVQSQVEPDWARLPNDYLLHDFNELQNPALKRIDGIYGGLHKGMRLRFRLRANPTKRISSRNSRHNARWHGKRIELTHEKDQIEWLQRKAKQHGFRLSAVRANPEVVNLRASLEGKVIGRRNPSEQPLKFGSVLFEGELEITHADDFRKALIHGIGSGKTYGFGLLSVAPICR